MKRLATLTVLICLLFSPVLAKDKVQPEPRKTSKADQRRIDAARKEKAAERKAAAKKFKKENEALGKELATLMAGWEKKGFSGAILVMKDGVELLKKGYGFADREAKRENAADTLYDIGSVTKMFTAAGVLRLEQDGKLKMEDTLGKFFAFAPADKKGITLTQLLSHTSGLSMRYDEEIDLMSRDNTVKGLLGIKLSSEPGTKFEYSNTNYFIAGAVIEVASGEKYEDYMQKNVLEAAGLKDSAFCSSEKLDDERSAMRYEDGQLKGDVTNWPFTWGQRGCGYLVSTVEDFWRWSEAIDNSDFLDEEAKKKWFAVQKDDYALGWCCKDIHETWAQYHGGAAPGARAYFARFPDKDIMYAFFMNVFETGKFPEFEIAADLEKLLLAD
jgi:CubicO group peptidase (beta-lactamase class C family)